MKVFSGIKHVYFKFLFQFIAILLLPVVFASTLYIFSIQLAEQSCIDSSLVALRHIRSQFDNYIGLLDQVATQMLFEPQIDKVAKISRPEYGSTKVYQIHQFTDTLKNLSTSSMRIDTSFILLLKDVSAAYYKEYAAFGLEFFFEKILNYNEMDYQQWYDTVFSSPSSFLIPMQPITYDGQNISAITYGFPINPGHSSNKIVLFLIDKNKLDEFLNNDESSVNYNLYVTGSDGNLIYQETDFDVDYNRYVLPDNVGGKTEGFYFDTVDNRKYMVAYTRSKSKDVVFTALIPQSVAMEKVIFIQRITWLMILLYAFIGGISAVYIAKRNSKPVNDLAGKLMPFVREMETSEKSRKANEYDYIKNGVDYLISYSGNMEDTVNQTYDEMKDIFFERLFSGSFNNREDILQAGEKLKLNLEGFFYCVAILEIKTDENELREDRSELFQAVYRQVCQHLPGFVCSARLGKSRIGLLFVERSEDSCPTEQIMKLLLQIRAVVWRQQGFTMVAGLGRAVTNLTDVQFSYEQALFVLKNVARNNGEIYQYDDMPDSTPENIFFYPIEMEYKLINFTRAGDQESIRLLMDTIIEENIIRRKLTRRVAAMLMTNLQSTLLKICSDTSVAPEYSQSIRRLNVNMPQADVLDEIKKIFQELSSLFAEKKNRQKEMMGKKAVQFIQEHFSDPMMGVPMVAELFNYSESYFSQFFKDYTGQSFSVYLEQFRVNKAKKLIEEYKMDIERIAGMVGYNSSNTFRRAFKRVVGLSPSNYRESIQE